MEDKSNLKTILDEQLELQHQHGDIRRKYRENNELLRKFIAESEQENSKLKQRIELYEKIIHNTQCRVEIIQKLQNRIFELNAKSRADQKKMRMLVKNNEKKRKLLHSEAMKWDEYAGKEPEGEDYTEEEYKQFEELEACWESSEESSDEVDNEN